MRTAKDWWRSILWCGALALAVAGCAGSGGAGGDDGDDDVTPPGPPPDPTMLIDDLDDGDSAIHEAQGRIGAWYVFNDETAGATQTPPATGDFVPTMGGASGAGYAAATTGSGFKTWGAGMGLDLNNPGTAMVEHKEPWNASLYQGIVLKAKGNAPLRVQLLVKGVVPKDVGGDCAPSDVEGKMCEDGHGRVLNLSKDWKEYKLPFAELKQEGWGMPTSFDPSQLVSIHFLVAQGVSFDVAVDDVAFF